MLRACLMLRRNPFTKGSKKNGFELSTQMIFEMSNVVFMSTQHDMFINHVK